MKTLKVSVKIAEEHWKCAECGSEFLDLSFLKCPECGNREKQFILVKPEDVLKQNTELIVSLLKTHESEVLSNTNWNTLNNVDWNLFNDQRLSLVRYQLSNIQPESQVLDGIINFMDFLQDEASDKGYFKYPEEIAISSDEIINRLVSAKVSKTSGIGLEKHVTNILSDYTYDSEAGIQYNLSLYLAQNSDVAVLGSKQWETYTIQIQSRKKKFPSYNIRVEWALDRYGSAKTFKILKAWIADEN